MPGVVVSERRSMAIVIAYFAEYERRRLHLVDGYPTMYAYAIDALGYSEDAAWRRVKAAEAARKFPVILPMLADGRLHLTAVTMLSPHLTLANADELLVRVARLGKKAIEGVLAERFPRADLPARLDTLAPAAMHDLSTLYNVAPARNDAPMSPADQPQTASPDSCNAAKTSEHVMVRPAKLAIRAPERFGLQVTIDQTTHDLLRRAQDLLSHQVPNGDLATVLRRVLEAAVPVLEKRRFGAGRKPRSSATAPVGRHIPMHVRRAVLARDQGQCTFVGDNGHRCAARRFLEFDHVTPFARGGPSTVENLRLRCRAHNQYEAIRLFGGEFMAIRSVGQSP